MLSPNSHRRQTQMKGTSGLLGGLMARLRSLWRGLRRRALVEDEMREEFRQHLELRTEDLIRRGMAPEEAARRARLEFGHIDVPIQERAGVREY